MYRLSQYTFVCAAALAGCGGSIHDAIARDDLQRVRELLEAEPARCNSRNELGKTPMHYAVNFATRPDILQYLIDAGCDVNAKDATGMTPLHVAAFIDLSGAAKLLLGAGAQIDARDAFGDTPLHTAAMQGASRVAPVLLREGADPSLKNDERRTPYDLARLHGHVEVAELLRQASGARP